MIGSNLVQGLNAIGIDDVIAVDDLTDGPKYRNLLGARLSDYFDRSEFYGRFARGELGRIDAVFHEGACSDTMEHNGRFMLDSNYRCSKDLLDACQAQGTRLLYASSAATYGGSASFREEPEFEQPLNVYGWSKLLFDNVVRRALPDITHAGRRLPLLQRVRPARAAQGPDGVGGVPSPPAARADRQGQAVRRVRRLRAGPADARLRLRRRCRRGQPLVPRAPGSERHLQPGHRAARSRSTTSRSPRSTARVRNTAARRSASTSWCRSGTIEYIPFPDALVGKYQCFTQADLSRLRAVGCEHAFADVGTGVRAYVDWLSGAP